MRRTGSGAIVGTLGLLACFAGCIGTPLHESGTNGYVFSKGAGRRVYRYSVSVVADGVEEGLRDIGLAATFRNIDRFGGIIKTKTTEGSVVVIRLRPDGTVTEINVKVGTKGDASTTEQLVSAFDKHLTPTRNEPKQEKGLSPTAVDAAKPALADRRGPPPRG